MYNKCEGRGLGQTKIVIKTEVRPRFLQTVFICHKREGEVFIVTRFNSEIFRDTILCLSRLFSSGFENIDTNVVTCSKQVHRSKKERQIDR